MIKKLKIFDPGFLNSYDGFLLKNLPLVWVSRVHYLFFYFLCTMGLMLLAYKIIPLSKINVPPYRLLNNIMIILIILFLAGYVYYSISQNRYKKINVTLRGLFTLFLIYYMVFWFAAIIIIGTNFLVCNKVKSTVPLAEHKLVMNNANIILSLSYSEFLSKLNEYDKSKSIFDYNQELYEMIASNTSFYFSQYVDSIGIKDSAYFSRLKNEADSLNIFKDFCSTEKFLSVIDDPEVTTYDSLGIIHLNLLKIPELKNLLNGYGYNEYDRYESPEYGSFFAKIQNIKKFIDSRWTFTYLLWANIAVIWLVLLLLLSRSISWKSFGMSLGIALAVFLLLFTIIKVAFKSESLNQIAAFTYISLAFLVFYVFQVLKMRSCRKVKNVTFLILNALNILLFIMIAIYSFACQPILKGPYGGLIVFNILTMAIVALFPLFAKPYLRIINLPRSE